MPRRNYAPAPRMAPPPKPMTPVAPPQVVSSQGSQPSLFKNAASIAGGVAVGNVVGNMATSALLGPSSSHAPVGMMNQPALGSSEHANTLPPEFKIQNSEELAWVNCLRHNTNAMPEQAIECVKKILNCP